MPVKELIAHDRRDISKRKWVKGALPRFLGMSAANR